jgi:hypothetical protein
LAIIIVCHNHVVGKMLAELQMLEVNFVDPGNGGRIDREGSRGD